MSKSGIIGFVYGGYIKTSHVFIFKTTETIEKTYDELKKYYSDKINCHYTDVLSNVNKLFSALKKKLEECNDKYDDLYGVTTKSLDDTIKEITEVKKLHHFPTKTNKGGAKTSKKGKDGKESKKGKGEKKNKKKKKEDTDENVDTDDEDENKDEDDEDEKKDDDDDDEKKDDDDEKKDDDDDEKEDSDEEEESDGKKSKKKKKGKDSDDE